MKLSNKKSIQQIVLTLATLGLKHVVISPGSRNAPLTISFNQHPQFHCTSIRDERSAAFYALGKAIESKEPVAILCSSGSAVLNFAPAIVEAFYLRIPLIVITADRPAEWIGQMDGQTMNQTDVYQNYIRKSYTLNGDAETENDLWHNAHCLNEGFAIATKMDPGPVHFNVPLKEPLFILEEVHDHIPPVITLPEIEVETELNDLNALHSIFSNTKKVMVLAGQNTPDKKLNDLLVQLGEYPNTIVLTEATTNLHHPDFISNIDRCIMPMKDEDIPEFMPDLLITIGGAIVSKKIKELLRKNKPHQHWNIHPHDCLVNTYQALTKAIPMGPVHFLEQLLKDLPKANQANYKEKWLRHSANILQKHQQYLGNMEYSDLSAFAEIYNRLPSDTTIHYSNSSPIRYAQLFDNSRIKSIHCNRGTSGIDGCTSTAMGAASINPDQPYILITGDVAFFYDNNAFWNDRIPENLKIILINNAGGGIFRIIKGPGETEELEEFFETKHSVSAKKLMDFYEWDYLSAHDEKTLGPNLDQFFARKSGKVVLEIFTPNEVNSHILAQYFKYLAS
ncbi:MAG: 2-succinyl-5-enolpyruvyl-6-hydroxy-3-cyclohexene-1-carboxylic-acid synthase [Ginsengibacter sp.]